MSKKTRVLIRFNTKNDNNDPSPWRVLVAKNKSLSNQSYETYFADNVILEVPSRSSEDDVGQNNIKWHLTAYGVVSWVGKDCYIKP